MTHCGNNNDEPLDFLDWKIGDGFIITLAALASLTELPRLMRGLRQSRTDTDTDPD